MESVLLDVAGHRRSPATMPGYHRGRSPRKKGEHYPADPPTVEEIVSVMRIVGDRAEGQRLRALIVVLWRAGLRISEALALAESDLDVTRGAILVRRGKGGKRREAGMDRWAWRQLEPWFETRLRLPIGGAAVRDPRCDRRAALGGISSAQATPPRCGLCGNPTAVRAAPAAARACGRDGARRRATCGHSASARTREPWDHQRLSARD